MKTKFNSYDVVCMTAELQRLVGLRVHQLYDIDNKTYLIKFQEKDIKETLLIESGSRFHTTAFEWPKNPSPSGFTMKLRKHLKNKRLETLKQLGNDRIIIFQFGIGESTFHLILELFNRGNLILCDGEMITLNVLRPHTEGESIRFVVREKYPEARGRTNADRSNREIAREALDAVNDDDWLKRIFTPILQCGPTVFTHVLMKYELVDLKVKGKNPTTTDAGAPDTNVKSKKAKKQKGPSDNAQYFDETKHFDLLVQALDEADAFITNVQKNGHSKGYIFQKSETKPSAQEGGEPEEFLYNVEYHPYLFEQYRTEYKVKEFERFDTAVDEFYSSMISQKIDMKTFNQECEALKKLSNVKMDHAKRLDELNKVQILNRQRAELITRNQDLVNSMLITIRNAIANQMSWTDIAEFVRNAQTAGDYVAQSIKQLKLETNHVSLYLTDPYAAADSSSGSETDDESGDSSKHDDKIPAMVVDIDLGLSAYGNATRFYDQKKTAAQKEHRTIVSSAKALKNAEKKTQEHLKEVRAISNISKARKVYWFEKFYWFISSENYLVIGGRDQQQNELIVKRYLRPNDIYVHADIQGASSIVIRNPFTGSQDDPQAAIPPKTLLEAGAMAISYSVAWEAKVTTSAYWVRSDQVSKTAPTGEYLGTGSFMIRGKKNFLPPCHLILGLSLMFKLEESSVERHLNERGVRKFDDASDKRTGNQIGDIEHAAAAMAIVEETGDVPVPEAEDNDNGSADEDNSSIRFPDTHVRVGGSSYSTQVSVESTATANRYSVGDEEEGAIIHAVAQQMPRKNRVIQKAKEKGGKKNKQQQELKKQEIEKEESEKSSKPNVPGQLKRGQKSKLKKIKEKYKDQDEEEKLMRMEILKSAGNKKPAAAASANAAGTSATDKGDETEKPREPKVPYVKRVPIEREEREKPDAEGDEEEGGTESADVELLNTLTGCPCEEDELLFALPVVAPYNALQNYKYRVKITPGTGRRGKTAKTAFDMFLKDKSCSNLEKDLIKAIKHDVAARNMPGKVKLSAPQMQRLRN